MRREKASTSREQKIQRTSTPKRNIVSSKLVAGAKKKTGTLMQGRGNERSGSVFGRRSKASASVDESAGRERLTVRPRREALNSSVASDANSRRSRSRRRCELRAESSRLSKDSSSFMKELEGRGFDEKIAVGIYARPPTDSERRDPYNKKVAYS